MSAPAASARDPESQRSVTHKSPFATLIGTGEIIPASHRRKTLTAVGTPFSALDPMEATADSGSAPSTSAQSTSTSTSAPPWSRLHTLAAVLGRARAGHCGISVRSAHVLVGRGDSRRARVHFAQRRGSRDISALVVASLGDDRAGASGTRRRGRAALDARRRRGAEQCGRSRSQSSPGGRGRAEVRRPRASNPHRGRPCAGCARASLCRGSGQRRASEQPEGASPRCKAATSPAKAASASGTKDYGI